MSVTLGCLFQKWLTQDEVAEWLRRQTANLLGSAREGSNPFLVESFFSSYNFFIKDMDKDTHMIIDGWIYVDQFFF